MHKLYKFSRTLRQKRGTAFGTKFAPPYAILYMADLEKKLLEIFERKPIFFFKIHIITFTHLNVNNLQPPGNLN